jgi:BCD family chlorophyll transporter-like MFS transporter
MNRITRRLLNAWMHVGVRYLPFADAASPGLPLSRLLRLSLIQVSVGMALVLLVGTLNRVMIVELDVPASLVAIMLSLPVLAAPFRALIGFRSDTHKSALGWKRVPFIWRGTLVQFGGLAIMPFALLVLGGQGDSPLWPLWIGHLSAAVAFLLVGAGLHTTQTVGLALATDQAPVEDQPKVVGLMYVMLLAGMISSALIFGALLQDFTPGRLIQVVQGSAVVTIFLNVVALWKQEAISRPNPRAGLRDPTFAESWQGFIQGGQARRRLAVIGLGTMAFTMQDVLLEPFGGEVLGLSVSATTLLTACLAGGGLVGFAVASRVLSRGFDPFRMAGLGALLGLPGFLGVILAAPMQAPPMFALAIVLIGLGGGLFGHGTLTATMQFAPRHQVGLALGAWGAVQATAAGVAVGLGGVLRDVMAALLARGAHGDATSYIVVYSIEVALLLATLAAMAPLLRRSVAPRLSVPPA